ncbi:MAG: hypothetical protein ACE5JC_07080 [Candidatus Zixiibacteriota bacterium]
MSPRIDGLIVSATALYSRLSGWQRIGIVIALGVLVFVFLGTIGVKQSPPRAKLSGFKPYRPERPVLVKRNIAGLGGETKKDREYPRPPGPGVEVSILEEIKSVKSQLEELRSLVVNSSESAGSSVGDTVTSAISEVHSEVRLVLSKLKNIDEKLKRDEQALKEQSPIELLAIISAGGFKYAMLRTEAGDKRVTEGDRVGPWMVVRIEEQEVSLEGSNQSRILRLK